MNYLETYLQKMSLSTLPTCSDFSEISHESLPYSQATWDGNVDNNISQTFHDDWVISID